MTPAAEWDAQFERETGKVIVDGKLSLRDYQGAVLRAMRQFTLVNASRPSHLKISPDVERGMMREALSERRFMGGELGTFMGLTLEVDYALPECGIVVQ